VAAGIEHGVEIFLLDAVEANSLVKLGFRGGVGLEAQRQVGAEFGLVALGVERRTAALGEARVISAPESLKMK
jgi:hypothetical protein